MYPILTNTTYNRQVQNKLEDTKGLIRIRKSKKDRQFNGKKNKGKMTNNDT